jgi:hypothetical protein
MDPARSGRSSDVKHTYLMDYQREMNDLSRTEAQIAEQNTELNTELVNAHTASADPVEAGMKESFQEGISAALKSRNNKKMAALALQRESVHLKYHKMILKAGYDWSEFEPLMCLSHDPEKQIKPQTKRGR